MKITLLKSLMISSAFLCFGLTQAQEVTGTVSDANGPLPGASVVVKGTTNGTQTDFDGNYTINVGSDATLVFSYIGYLTSEIAVNGQSTINVTMEEDAQALEEVVIVGYGSQNKKEITSAVVQLDAEEFNKGVVNSPAQLLQGKVAGLTITNRGGDPNSNGTIRLRGLNTIGANTEPLVVVDGVIGASLNNIDPNDIENINVLKDGSAAAIYGSRGSSGVILVTTKRGSGDKTTFEYSGQLSVSSIANTVDVMSASEFRAAGGVDLGFDNNWIDLVTLDGTSKINNFAVSGSSDKTNYRVSANFRKVDGILRNSGFDQFNTRANINTSILNDKLKVGFNTSFTNRNSEFGFYEALRYAVLYNPTAPLLGKDSPFAFNANQFGGYFEALGLFDSFNPRSIIEQNINDGKRTEFLAGVDLKYALSNSISLNATYSKQNNKNNNRQYYSPTSHFRGEAASSIKGRVDIFNDDYESDLFEAFATIAPTLGEKSSLSVTAGYSWQEQNWKNNSITLRDFPNNNLNWSDNYSIAGAFQLGGASRISGGSFKSPEDRIIAFFGRVNYTLDNAIFFNASVRHEGSTRLGSENQWGTFPSVGVGADLNRYLELPNVNLLKVRVGYGVTGSLPGGNGFSREIYGYTGNSSETGWATTFDGGRAANPDLKWEQKAETNFGLEFATDRLSATLDVYSRNNTDFIIPFTVEASVHPSGIRYSNAGKIQTNGVELALNYDLVKTENVNYNSGIVFSTYKSVLKEYLNPIELRGNLGAPGQNDTQVILIQEGEEIGQIVGAQWTGEVDANGSQTFVDVDGDGTIETDQTKENFTEGDLTTLGKGIPDFELGWTNRLTIGKWDINAFFRGQFGHSLVNNYRVFFEPRVGSQTGYNFVNSELADERIKTAKFSSHYVEKADFFRLDNLSVSYTFEIGEGLSKYLKGLTANIAGQNLFTITNYTGNDPEAALSDVGSADNGGAPANLSNPDPLVPGIDRRNNYFTSRTFSLGVVAKF